MASENDAKAGDIVIVNQGAGAGNNGHTAILLGKWQGKATKIIEQGGVGDKVNESTFGTAFYSLLSGSDVTLARPIKKYFLIGRANVTSLPFNKL